MRKIMHHKIHVFFHFGVGLKNKIQLNCVFFLVIFQNHKQERKSFC